MNETRRLIIEEVNRTHDAKIFAILLGANKNFLATHLFAESGDGLMELLKGEQLEKIQDKFFEMSLPNIHNLVLSFKHRSGHGYIDSILELKFKNCYEYIQECNFPRQVVGQKVFIFKMSINGAGSGASLVM